MVERIRSICSLPSAGVSTFHAGAIQGAVNHHPGEVDYRLARRHLINEFKRGRLAQHEVCDAHPELVRAGREVGTPTAMGCPICEDHAVVLITYVFGPRLPSFGRCITKPAELKALANRNGDFTAYVVEVCPGCSWNHLFRVFPLVKAPRARAPRRAEG